MPVDTPLPSELPLAFHPLSFVPEGEDVLVGRRGTDSYAVLPSDGAEVLERMTRGVTPRDVAAWYEESYGERLDIDDFVASMAELGFLREAGEPVAPESPVRLQRLARALFSPLAFGVYAVVIGAWFVVMTRHPDLVPDPEDVFFTKSMVLVQLLIVFGQIPLLCLHEGAHVLAGRRLGLPSELGFGTRLHVFVVFETRMPSLLSVPRRRRYLVFLAGMLLDVLAIAGLSLLAYSLRDTPGVGHTVSLVALAMVFPICTRFAYQFLLFLQTDVYYVAATALGCYDLHAATRTLVRNGISRVLRRPDRVRPLDTWTARDLRVARWYAPFFAVGVCVLVAVWLFALIPVFLGIARLTGEAISAGPSGARFWDATVFIVLNVAQLAFFAWVILRNWVRARERARAATAAPQTGAFS
jgi:hypothetical protein